MPFKFLKYLQPTHYFRLQKQDGTYSYPKVSALPESVIAQLKKDAAFKSDLAATYELSWQALQLGYIGHAATYTNFKTLPVFDEYVFIRRYFHPAWVLYVLLLRLFSLHNPVKEIKAWYATQGVDRLSKQQKPIGYPDYKSFNSPLLESSPMVSVVIPTLNRYPYLKDVLLDLEKQDYKHFEVIIVDQTEDFQDDFYKGWDLNLQYWYQEEKALWKARNEAIQVAKGDYILLYDDDSLIESDWISQHLKTLDYFKADLSSGVSISTVGDKVPDNYDYFRVSDQLDTGNVLLKKSIFKAIGLFDRQFEKQRMGDGEYGLRSYLHGYLNISNPYAKRIHLKVGTGGLREMGSWDAFRTQNWFAPRPIPSVLYFFRSYFGNSAARWALLRTVPMSIMPYQFKSRKPMLVLGAVVSLFLVPLVVFQVCKSWRLSSVKIKRGALVKPCS